MIICVSNQYVNLKSELQQRGYNVTSDLSLQGDVIICNLKDGELNSLSSQNSIRRDGTVIIDKGSKNIDEIENILSNRAFNSDLG